MIARFHQACRWSALLLCSLGCSAILGIEDAERIEPGGAGGNGSGGTAVGGSGGTKGGGDAGGEGGSGAVEATLCETYCQTVSDNCQGELAVYTSDAICLSLCETLEPGTSGDTSADSVHCRLNQALAAEQTGEPDDHCPFAGLGGGDICGNNCDALCRAMISTCPQAWEDADECLTDCAVLEDLGGHNIGQDAGATVQCRLWHVGAATQASVPHCAHAAGAAPCVD